MELPSRADWRRTAERLGFVNHTYAGGPYWTDDACYALEPSAVEAVLLPALAELWSMSLAAVDHACGDDRVLASLGIPPVAWPLVRASWQRRDPTVCTKFDLAWDGHGAPRLHECNGDMPGGLFETALFQWLWLEDRLATGAVPPASDQFNRLHAALVAAFAGLPGTAPVHFAASPRNLEDGVWARYLADCAIQAGLRTRLLDIEAIGIDDRGRLTDAEDRPIDRLVKAYRWELLLREPFGVHLLLADQARLIEPAWKLILSSKGLLVWLWRLFPGHPCLLPCWFDGETGAPAAGTVVKPLFSNKGHNILLRDPALPGGEIRTGGGYGREGHVVQALHRLPVFARSGAKATPPFPAGSSAAKLPVSASWKQTGRSSTMRRADSFPISWCHEQSWTMLLEPPLTGERTYLHGVDILEALLAGTDAESDIRLLLRTAGSVAIEALATRPEGDEPVCGEFRYRSAGRPQRLWLRHRPDRPVGRLHGWTDDALVREARLGDGWASQGRGGPAGPLHRAVALALALLERSHPDDYWSIAEIACDRPPPRDGTVAITVVPRLGWRFCRTDLTIDGERLGHILMARGQPRRGTADGTGAPQPVASGNASGGQNRE